MPDRKPGGIGRAVLVNESRPEHLRLSAEQLAAHLGVKVSSIHERMSRLRAEGRLRPSERQVAGAALPLPDRPAPTRTPSVSSSELLAVLERGDVLGRDERLRLASHLARTGPAPISVGAVRLLDDLDPRPREGVGPRDPLDSRERIERLSALMVACGRDVSLEALRVAEASSEWTTSPEMSAASVARLTTAMVRAGRPDTMQALTEAEREWPTIAPHVEPEMGEAPSN